MSDPTIISPMAPTAPSADLGKVEAINDIPEMLDDAGKKLFMYAEAKDRLNQLLKSWQQKVGFRAAINRNIRDIDIDIKALHNAGELRPDETLIPIRVVDENIKQDLPPYIRYLTTSHRLVVFSCTDDPNENTEELETQVTKGLRYNNWETTPFKNMDGAKLHGWSAIKVEYDAEKPLKVNLAYTKHEALIFDVDSVDLQANEIILEEHTVTLLQLDGYVKNFGFDKQQVDMLRDRQNTKINIQEPFKIYNIFFKYQDLVYTAWAALPGGGGLSGGSGTGIGNTSDWLKAPSKFWLGIKNKVTQTQLVPQVDPMSGQMIQVPQPVDSWENEYETQYPYEINFNDETENPLIISHKGRAWKDQSKQEAQTALYSLYINGAVRASNVYGSPKQPSGNGTAPKKLELSLDPGCFYSEPMEFWNPPYPSPEILMAADKLDNRTQAERGRTASAVINRDDARKTSQELKQAGQDQDEMESVGLTMYSSFWRNILARSWRIIQSQALQETISLLQVQVPDPMTGQVTWKNDLVRLGKKYEVFPAGDVDVVERDKELQKMTSFWPIVQATPVALPFLLKMLKAAFPKDAKEYEVMLKPYIMMQMMQMQATMMGGGAAAATTGAGPNNQQSNQPQGGAM